MLDLIGRALGSVFSRTPEVRVFLLTTTLGRRPFIVPFYR